MNFYDFIKKGITDAFLNEVPLPFGTGALLDDRTLKERAGDVSLGDIVAKTNTVDWSEKPESQWRSFPEKNQGMGNSCMANAYAKTRGVLSELRDGKYIDFSAADEYQRRANSPDPGMYLYDLFDIGGKGLTLEALVPSEQLSDAQIDSIVVEPHERAVGDVFATDDTPIYIPNGDFDACASVIQTTGKAIVSMFYFTAREWSRQVPEVMDSIAVRDAKALRHGIALVDAFSYKGVQYIRAEDSAHFGGFADRLITREMFEARNFGNGYDMGFKFDEGAGKRPKWNGTIVSLQECLRWLGLFPTNVSYVEHIGPVTTAAVKAYQEKFGIKPAVGYFGPITQVDVRKRFP